MLEIFGIMALCRVNMKNAAARGEKTGKYIAFTVLLWFGLEIIGALIGAFAGLELGAYIVALVFAGIGGFISYMIAKGSKEQSASVPEAIQPSDAGVSREQLMVAARAVFNNSFSNMVFDPDDILWKEPIQNELNLLIKGGTQSVSVLEELLKQCAAGWGGSISESWWYGSKWAVKAAAMLPRNEAALMMVHLLQKDSNIYEWFNYVQYEAAKQLCVIGTTDELPALQGLLEKPFSMSPVSEIARAVEKISGEASQTPSAILHRAEDSLGDEEGIEFLLSLMDQVQSWDEDNIGFYYYLLARKSEALGYPKASRAFYAAQIAARPDATSMGWREFAKDGITASLEAAQQLHMKYPVPKSMEEIKGEAATSFGTEVLPENTETKKAPKKNEKKKKRLPLIIGSACAVVIAIIGLSAYFLLHNSSISTSKQFGKAYEHLECGEYELALEQFIAAIDADKENAEAYIGAADAYIGLERTDKAVMVLEKGYENTDSMRIQHKLDGLLEADTSRDAFANTSGQQGQASKAHAESTDPNGPGNTCGNVSNGALAAMQGDWIFYASSDGICKIKSDGSGETLLVNGSFSCINVAGDWLYFIESSEKSIYKMRTDGSEKTPILEEPVANICVDGGFIYFTNYLPYDEGINLSEAGIYKIRTDGSQKTLLSYDLSSIINVANDWIYYIDNSSAICKVRTDGSQGTLLSNGFCGLISVLGDWIYYVDSGDNNIYKISTDGSQTVRISDEPASYINVVDEWIYYTNFNFMFDELNDETGLYKMRTDGSQKTRLTNDLAFIPNVVGDWIHYLRLDMDYNLDYCKVRTDGTQQRTIG